MDDCAEQRGASRETGPRARTTSELRKSRTMRRSLKAADVCCDTMSPAAPLLMLLSSLINSRGFDEDFSFGRILAECSSSPQGMETRSGGD